MRARLRHLALVLALVAPALAAPAPGVAQTSGAAVDIVEFGLYAVGPMQHVAEPDQLSGQRWRATTRLLERTDTIPGQLGRVFGIRFRVNDPQLHGRALTVRIRHPQLTAPSGRSGTETTWQVVPKTNLEEGYFFAFEATWEIAEGDWTFEIVQDGRVLAAKKFRVIVSMY